MKRKLFERTLSTRVALVATTALLLSTSSAFAASDYGTSRGSSSSTTGSGAGTGSSSSTRSGTGSSSTMGGSSSGSVDSSSSRNGTTASSSLDRSDRRFIMQAARSGETEVALSQVAMERASNPDVRSFASRLVSDHEKANAQLMALAERKGVDLPTPSTMPGMGSGSGSSSMSSPTTSSGSTSSGSTMPSTSSGSSSTNGTSGSATSSRMSGSSTGASTSGGAYGTTTSTTSPSTSNRGMSSTSRSGSRMDSEISRKVADLEKKQGADFDRAYIDQMIDDHKDDIKLFQDASKYANDSEVKTFAAEQLPTLQQHNSQAEQLKRTVKSGS